MCSKHKAFLQTIEVMLGNYGTVLMTGHSNGITDSQQHNQLNMEYIGACIQEHFQEVSRNTRSNDCHKAVCEMTIGTWTDILSGPWTSVELSGHGVKILLNMDLNE